MWKTVPVEPTSEMLAAARNAPIPAVMLDSISGRMDLELSSKWSAMLAASPKDVPGVLFESDKDGNAVISFPVPRQELTSEKLRDATLSESAVLLSLMDSSRHIGDVRAALVAFARAVEAAHGIGEA